MAAPYESARSLLIETVCRDIAESSALQQARVDAYLDGALRAAEQVQDVRIGLLEAPKEVSGWDFWFEIGVVFLLESNVVGALLKAIGSRIFVPMLRSNAVWSRIPKSATGRELIAAARQMRTWPPLIDATTGLRVTPSSVLSQGFRELPGRTSPDALRLYHSAIQQLAHVMEPVDVANGVAKAVNQARTSGAPTSPSSVAATDTAGVQVISGVQDYARLTRLGIQVRAARSIAYARSAASLDDLDLLSRAFEAGALDVGGSALSLADVATESSLAAEALIWARLYGFWLKFPVPRGPSAGRASMGRPELGTTDEEPLKGIPRQLVEYWFTRFGPVVETWRSEMGWSPQRGPLDQAIYLRAYLATVSAQFDEQAAAARPTRGSRTGVPSSGTGAPPSGLLGPLKPRA